MAAVPDAVLSFLLQNLKDFVVTSAQFIGDAQDKAEALCSDLEVLNGFLKKCTEERYRDDNFLAGLAKKVRNLVYRAEDAIETYIATVSKQKFRGAFRSAIHAIDHARELRKIGKELNDLKEEVHKAYDKEIEKGFLAIAQKEKGKDDDKTIKKHPVNDDMVGFKDAMEDVMGFLNDGTDELQTVSIVGMLGLGKTTLARQVFKHPTVEFQFFIRAFVEVSQEFKRKDLLLKLVRAFGNISADEMNRMHEEDLEDAIKKYLNERNYLIVLDDVWTEEVWNQLKTCFPNNQKHSRVLITTRNKTVAEHARQGRQGLGIEPYELRFLDDMESKELLRKRVFGQTDNISSDLKVHETAILVRCAGLPLAIVVVAGILINHREESYWWEDVSKKVETYNLAKKADYAIKLSFNHLPFRLKPCFLYLGVFREDFEIPSRTLYQLWVSEGFVPPGDANESSEDKAESYLEQLVDRSLVMVDKRRLNGRIKTIRIHDTLREFCKMQAIEEELFREIKDGEESSKMSSDNDRRLCINSNVPEYTTSKSKRTGKFVRSFLSFAKEDYILPLEYISDIPKAFNLLRVLDVRSIRFTRFPPELFYTFLLKYIAMYSDLETIPEKVSNLRYLQTFIFNTTKRSIQIKADIWKMKQLRHLETNASASLQKTKEALSDNKNLQTLSSISPESCTLEVFKRAKLLKKLGISGELAPFMDTLFPSFIELGCLENLKLLNADTAVPLKSLPNDNSFPCKLTRLTLQNTRLNWEWMSTLAKLKKLEVLKLKENAFVQGNWDTESTGCFNALKVLHIGNTDLITWKASKGHFPHLRQLYLRHCSKLGNIPSDLVNISTLKLIDIYCCKPEVANSAVRLVYAKLQVQAQEKNGKNTQLKLFIYPPQE